jgi:hypothetical protein
MDAMIDIRRVTALHEACIARWHQEPVDCPFDGFWRLVCRQLGFNFLLWHEEDKARSPSASDAEIAQVKRQIDRLNQERNDWIERLDDWVTQELTVMEVVAAKNAPLNTETLGSTIDRLGILALRIYHLREQLDRLDAGDLYREKVSQKLFIATVQHDDLAASAQSLADDLLAGRKRHQAYRQLKMYNDPMLNPYLYDLAAAR